MDGEAIRKTLKKRLFTGLFITFPLVLTIWAVVWLFDLLDGILGHVLDGLIGHHYPGLGFAIYVLGVYGVGLFATTVLGRRALGWMERLMLRLPVVKSIYSTFKQLGDAFSPENRAAFKKFVIVEYPRAGSLSFGFLTKECTIKTAGGKEECYAAVYIPTNHLYLGEITMFRKDEVIVTDLTIEDGIKIILSAGIAAPNVISKGRSYPGMATQTAAVTPPVQATEVAAE